MQLEHYHCLELPVAQLAALYAAANQPPPRKGRSRPKPRGTHSFCLFASGAEAKEISAHSTYLSLLKGMLLPHWCFYCFKYLKSEPEGRVPLIRAWIGEDVVILCPTSKQGGAIVEGFFIPHPRKRNEVKQVLCADSGEERKMMVADNSLPLSLGWKEIEVILVE